MTEKTIYDIVHIEQKAAKEVVFMLVPSKTYGLGLFDDFFDTPFSGRRDFSNTLMKTDVQEKDGNYILDMDLPGFAKEDIKAELADGYLTIRAEKKSQENRGEGSNYIFQERYHGTCQRSFYVGEGVEQEDIHAAYQDGILRLVFPRLPSKKIEEKKKYIAIE